MEPELKIETEGPVIRMTLPGPSIDRTALSAIEEQMLATVKQAHAPRIVVDFRAVAFLPTIGLGTLIAVQKWTRQQGGRLRIAEMQGRVRELFHISRLDRIFDIDDTLEQALERVMQD